MLERLTHEVYGDYAVSVSASILTSKRIDPGKPNPEMLALRNLRICFFNECEMNTTLNSAIVKELCGKDPVTFRNLYESKLSLFVQTVLPILLCNHPPACIDMTHSIWRRICIIPFEATFTNNPVLPNERLNISDIALEFPKWKDYLSTYLIRECYRNFIEAGEDYQLTDDVMSLTERYRTDSDRCLEWFADSIEVTNNPREIMGWSQMYALFVQWHKSQHPNEFIIQKKDLKPQIEKCLGVEIKVHKITGQNKTIRGWTGIRYIA